MTDFLFKLPTALPNPPSVDTELPAGYVDHVAAALSRLCHEFVDKQGIVDLLTIFAARWNDLETVFQQLLAQRFNVYNATGAMLDLVGKLVGQPRNGMIDSDYQRYIFARISTNRSDGTVEQLIAIAKLILNAPATIQVDQQGYAGVVIRIVGLTVTDAIANVLVDFLQPAAYSGVHVIIETQYVVDSDTWCFGIDASLVGVHSIGANVLIVNSTVGFPTSGSLHIDTGLITAETITYTGVTATHFIGISVLTQNHADGSCVDLAGSPGKGMGDTSDGTAGGELQSARDSHYP